MIALLDVNVLVALFDAAHQHHVTAKEWLHRHIRHRWASCPITQNGFVRVLSQPSYSHPVPVVQAMTMLAGALTSPHHEFWPDDFSIAEEKGIDRTRIHGPRQLTDIYLLAQAVRRGGRFVTFDRAIPLSAVAGASGANLVAL